MKLKDYKTLCNELIDCMIDLHGLSATIEYLIDFGLDKKDLLSMNFDEVDIDRILEEL